MRVSRILLVLAVTLPLGACLTATAEDFERHDDGVCRDMGLKQGTQAYVDCRQNVSSQRQMAARIGMQNQMWSLQGR
jgi:hypothetical protein